MRNDTFQVQMCCYNCGNMDSYDIPVRREIVGFERYWVPNHDYPDKPSLHSTYSCIQRVNGTDKQALLCSRCKLAELQPAYYVNPAQMTGVINV